jgi:hypothetical protein
VLDGTVEQDIARFIGRNTSTGGDADSLVGVDSALDYPLFNNLKPVIKGFSPPLNLIGMYQLRKQTEQFILSSHGDATRYFVTFVDNHDMKERIRFEQPGNPTQYDDQVTMAVGCLYALPGIPCLYRARTSRGGLGSCRAGGTLGRRSRISGKQFPLRSASVTRRNALRSTCAALRPVLFSPDFRGRRELRRILFSRWGPGMVANSQ